MNMPTPNGGKNSIQIVLPELHVRYMHAMDKMSFGNMAKKAIDAVDRHVEVHISLRKYFDEQWQIRESEVERFARDHARGIVRNGGSYHALIGIAPPFRGYNMVRLGDVDAYDRNLAALRAQIKLARRMSDACGVKRALLVVHLDAVHCESHHEETLTKITQMFTEAIGDAHEHNVHVSIEIDLRVPYGNCFGSSFENLAQVVRLVNSYAEKNGLNQRLGITYDFSHAIINFLGDFEKARHVIATYGDLITYAHINHPVHFPATPQVPHSKTLPRGVFHNFRTTMLALQSGDIHSRIYDVDKQEETHAFIKQLISDTRIRDTGLINLELSPKPTYLHRMLSAGASAIETEKSVRVLRDLINQA
jgi:hypothetical protein